MTPIQRLCGKITRRALRRRYPVCYEGSQYCRCVLCGFHYWTPEK